MADSSQKRKGGPEGSNGAPAYKKRQGGSAGRWKTPHQKAKIAEKVEMGTTLDVGDQGIWVTYARGMKFKAIREFKDLCDEYGKMMYGIEPAGEEKNEGGDEEADQDIEAAIAAELDEIKSKEKPKTRQTFTPVPVGIECLFFMKTMQPIEPVALVRKICEDARDCPDPRQRKCRYINRLTPVVDTEKATEVGIIKVARAALSPWFSLAGEEDDCKAGEATATGLDSTSSSPAYTYAIRHNVRNHSVFKSDEVIKKVAGLITDDHKVNLGKPDKVILVEIFQLFCGISVVDGKEWEALKRYNMNALYSMPSPETKSA